MSAAMDFLPIADCLVFTSLIRRLQCTRSRIHTLLSHATFSYSWIHPISSRLLSKQEENTLGMSCLSVYLITIVNLTPFSQCNGKEISWSHLMELYHRNRAQADDTRLALLPKLKFEHIHLTSFSKMRVDLAAQVRTQVKTL